MYAGQVDGRARVPTRSSRRRSIRTPRRCSRRCRSAARARRASRPFPAWCPGAATTGPPAACSRRAARYATRAACAACGPRCATGQAARCAATIRWAIRSATQRARWRTAAHGAWSWRRMTRRPSSQATDLQRESTQCAAACSASRRTLQAVGGVSFAIERGRTLAVVGESGCGKSTLARMVALIEKPTRGRADARRRRRGRRRRRAQRRELRKTVQMVFQNPYGSLNPRKKIGAILEEPLAINTTLRRPQRARACARRCWRKVGLRPEHYDRYPHMFSGGQRQRIAIARALMLDRALRRRRRAGLRARRVGPGAGAEPACRPAARARARLSLHLARPRRRAPHRARRAGDVPRPRDGAGAQGAHLRAPAASLHAGAARLDAGHRPHAAGAHRAQGRAAVAARSAAGLRLRHPLPARRSTAAAPSVRCCACSTAGR